jgi:hypothetical protein
VLVSKGIEIIMGLKIKSSDEFDKLLNALANELVNANIFFKLHIDLKSATTEYNREFSQSATFWSLTFQAHLDAALFRLCRIYDTYHTSNSLSNLLDTIKENLHIFDEANFRERLKDNPFVDSLAQYARKPDVKQLEANIEYTSENNSLVKNLIVLRNNIFAHRSAGNIIKGKNLSVAHPLTIDNISELLEKGVSILNHYSNLFRALSHSTQIVGHDDYKYVLSCIKSDLIRHEEEFQAELKKYSNED